MKLLDRAVLAAKVRMNALADAVTTKRDGGVGVIVTVILLVIAIGLLVSFKGTIGTWLSSISTKIGGDITSNFKVN